MSNSQTVSDFIKRRRIDLIQVLGGKCCICGYDKCNAALEFHHVNPKTKLFGISQTGALTYSLSKQLAEVKKCVLVCANCHREIHYDGLAIPKEWKNFYNEVIADKLMNSLYRHEDFKDLPLNKCPVCGKIIRDGETYCSQECVHKAQRIVQERPDRNSLKEMIRTMPFTTIGSKYGVTDNAIRKWCDDYGLPRKKKEIKSYSDSEWENV